LLLQLCTFLNAHVSPCILYIRDASIVNSCYVRIQHRNIHSSIQMLSLQHFRFGVVQNFFSQIESLLYELGAEIIKAALIEMLKFLLVN
jgi:hypothetical protein